MPLSIEIDGKEITHATFATLSDDGRKRVMLAVLSAFHHEVADSVDKLIESLNKIADIIEKGGDPCEGVRLANEVLSKFVGLGARAMLSSAEASAEIEALHAKEANKNLN